MGFIKEMMTNVSATEGIAGCNSLRQPGFDYSR